MPRLIRIQAEDFAGFKYFELDLVNQGLVFIDGNNQDSTSAISNGSGKTSILKCVGWCIYGKSIDGEFGDKIIRRGAKSARTKISIEDCDDTYDIIRERHKQSTKLFLIKNGEHVSASKQDLQLQINKLMGVDWGGFKNSRMYGQGDRDRFIYPTTSDSERKKILQKILNTEVFTLCFEEAKKRRRELDRKRLSIGERINALKDRISDHDLSFWKNNAKQYEIDRKNNIISIEKEIVILKSKHKKIDHTNKIKKLNSKIDFIESKIAKYNNRIERCDTINKGLKLEEVSVSGDALKIDIKLGSINKNLSLLKGKECPICRNSFSEGKALEHTRNLIRDKEKLSIQLKKLDSKRFKISEKIDKNDGIRNNIVIRVRNLECKKREIESDIHILEESDSKLVGLKITIENKQKELDNIKSEKNPYISIFKKNRKKIVELKKEKTILSKQFKSITKQLSILEFWVKGFGPTGMPSFALDSVMPFITDRANKYLNILSDGDISIDFNTQSKLKSSSDEYRDKIGVTWIIEGIEDHPPSGGQWKKMEIATNLAFKDLVNTRSGNNLNVMFADECFDGLDAEGRQRLSIILNKLRTRTESVFVISHDPDLGEIFDKTITVTRKNKVSRLIVNA